MNGNGLENRYFAAEELEARRRLAVARAERQRARRRELLKELHHNHCPRCGEELVPLTIDGQTRSRCPRGDGAWFDASELPKLRAPRTFAAKLTDAALNLFKRPNFWGPGK